MLTHAGDETISGQRDQTFMVPYQLTAFCSLIGLAFLSSAQEPPTMTKMSVRLTGPDIKRGSYAALPKVIYRAGDKYARMENAPNTRLGVERVTIIAEPDAFSVDLMNKTGTHAIDQGGPNDLHLPIILPFDPNHKLGILDRLEFGDELVFFQKSQATKTAGPIVNGKSTDHYTLQVDGGSSTLITRDQSDIPIFVSWTTNAGTYKYEYGDYQSLPFDQKLFSRPNGIKFREIGPPTASELEK